LIFRENLLFFVMFAEEGGESSRPRYENRGRREPQGLFFLDIHIVANSTGKVNRRGASFVKQFTAYSSSFSKIFCLLRVEFPLFSPQKSPRACLSRGIGIG
jgi:hypothetical protein